MNFLKLGIVLVGVCQIFDIAKYLILRSTVSFFLCHRCTCLVCVTVGGVLERLQILAEGMKVECFMALASCQQFEYRDELIFCHSYVHLTLPI